MPNPIRHCSDGERLPQGKWYCGPNCLDLLKDANTPSSEPAFEPDYAPELDDDYGTTRWCREAEQRAKW